MSKEEIMSIVRETLEKEDLGVDLSNLQLYYDGLAEEEFTSQGTAVLRSPVWYGGLEKFTLAVYELGKRICISLRIFFTKETVDKDIFCTVS